jgi:5,5'-dehydrodivanillate O-demethylase
LVVSGKTETEGIPEKIPFVPNPWQSPDGLFYPDRVNAQDMMMWITQGAVTDHRLEHLAESDRGVALYRRTLLEQFEKVARGEDPLGVVRDPAKNTPYITLPIERTLGYTLTGVNTGMYEFPERELLLPND